MGQDTIQAIREVEQKAIQIEQAAQAECAALVADAKSRAKAETEQLIAKVQDEGRAAVEKARLQAQEVLAEAEKQAAADAQSMRESCAAKEEEAIRMILSELIS